MRKSEFKLQAERSGDKLIFYKSMQYRWEDNETADPQIYDVNYHFTEVEAIAAAKVINLEIGFCAQVDRIGIDYDKFNIETEFRKHFNMSDLDDYRRFHFNIETIYTGRTNEGNSLDPDGIILTYRHRTFMNYAYSVESVDFVRHTNLQTEADLRNDADRLSSSYYLYVKDINELADMFMDRKHTPFDKLNSGGRAVREFLKENGHPDYTEE